MDAVDGSPSFGQPIACALVPYLVCETPMTPACFGQLLEAVSLLQSSALACMPGLDGQGRGPVERAGLNSGLMLLFVEFVLRSLVAAISEAGREGQEEIRAGGGGVRPWQRGVVDADQEPLF